MSKRSLNIAILGTGVFGRYHAQKAAGYAGVENIYLYDSDPERAQALSQELGLKVMDTAQAAIAASDAVIVAAPASQHEALALAAIAAGKHCLIEKPIAHSAKAGRMICDLAKEKGVIVHIGHQERYVLSAIGIDTIVSKPKLIEMHRETTFSPRGTDVSATLDLTVHDLDMVMWLMKDEPLGVLATGEAVHTDFIDRSRVELIYDKTKVVIHTSRAATTGRRTMSMTYAEGQIDIDFVTRSLTHNSPFLLNEDFAKDPRASDALGASDYDFFKAVLSGETPIISAEDGLLALDWALQIDTLILGA